jgi:hypothetical protein
MTDTGSIISTMFMVFLVAALLCLPVSAHEETAGEVAAEIVEHAEELVLLCGEIHDQTEFIADDDSLDMDLRELAEGIHVSSHELESVADHILEHALELQTLVAAGSGDSPEVEEAIDEINEHCEEFIALVESKHEDIHDLVFTAPETHEDYADATHDAAHEAGEVAGHVIEHTAELQGMLAGTAAASTTSSYTSGVTAADVSVEVAEIAEHSDELFTSAESILLDTKAIVKDETVDQEIRDLAKTIHLVSHELEDIAAGLQEDSAELLVLAADPGANKAAIKELTCEMQVSVTEYTTKLEAQHENIHELAFVAPESREENADAVHDAAHEAENVADHLIEHLEGLTAALDAPSAAQTALVAASTPAGAEATQTPGFGVVAATLGLLGSMAYLARRE